MNRVAIILIFFILMVALSIFYWDSEKPIVDESTYLDDSSNRVCFDDLCLRVKVVSTPREISRGLMYRDSLEEGTGMLFILGTETRRGFWMKNMKFPIDVLWISSDGRVVHVEHSVPACREDPCPGYAPSEKAKYVLETRANFTAENGIGVGSEARIYTF